MNLLPVCVVYTQDSELLQKVKGNLHAVARVQSVTEATRLESVMQQYDPALLLLDLQAENWRFLLRRVHDALPSSLIIALGHPRSEPGREAEAAGVYAVENAEFNRSELQAMVRHAQDYLRVTQENRILRRDALRATAHHPEEERSAGFSMQSVPLPLQHFAQAYRDMSNVDSMLDKLVNGIANWARVSRVGIFSISRGSETYRLRAGIRCLDTVREMEVSAVDPLVQWLQMNPHVISRLTLGHLEEPAEKLMLERSLDAMGAEVIVPLHGRSQIVGWLFVGRHITGRPYGHQDLETFMLLSDHVSSTLENALLYEEVAVQKTLAETLIHSLPEGIVAAGADGTLRWFNSTAEEILGVKAGEVLNKPLRGSIDGPLAGLLLSCLDGESQQKPMEWVTPRTKRYLSVVARRLADDDHCLGAVLILHDMTRERLLKERQEQLERASFWAELSAAMSHEIRNPLVAISTFAQLLPERYSDAEFREQFRTLVTREISRLNAMMDQINAFANPPSLDFRPANLTSVLRDAVKTARQRLDAECDIVISCDDDLPPVQADADELTECFSHLLVNAMEAVQDVAKPSLHLTVARDGDAKGEAQTCIVHVQDNGPGVPAKLREKVFSPFCTSKARGIGLGLPLVKRAVSDHGGEVSIATGGNGTTVTVSLPVSVALRYAEQEENTGRR